VHHLAHFRGGQVNARLAALGREESVAVGMTFDAAGELAERGRRRARAGGVVLSAAVVFE